MILSDPDDQNREIHNTIKEWDPHEKIYSTPKFIVSFTLFPPFKMDVQRENEGKKIE